MHPRQRMRESNRLARLWLLENKYDQIWFKSHTRRSDRVYTQDGYYRALDLWNLYDGACFDSNGLLHFFQIKTNRFAPEEPLSSHVESHDGFAVLNINVKKVGASWKVLVKKISKD